MIFLGSELWLGRDRKLVKVMFRLSVLLLLCPLKTGDLPFHTFWFKKTHMRFILYGVPKPKLSLAL